MSAPVIVFVAFKYASDLASNKDLIDGMADDNKGKLQSTVNKNQHNTWPAKDMSLTIEGDVIEQTWYFDRLWNAIWFIAQLAGMLHQGIIWIGFQGGTGL